MSASRRPVTGSGKRALVALAMGAITSPLLIGLTAGSASAAVDITTACPEDAFDDAGFTDIGGQNAQFQLAINCLAALGITTGQTETTFNPTGSITRAQFSQFLFRLGNLLEVDWDTADSGFEDLGGVSAEARNAINALRNAGVVNGRTETTFEPLAQVRRDQMASFLNQFYENVIGESLPGTVVDAFTDDEGNVHEDNINAIAAADIADGVAPNRYAPGQPVERAQMAAFVARTVQVLINEEIIPPLFDDGGTTEPEVAVDNDGNVTAGAEFTGTLMNLPEGATVTVSGAGLTDQAVTVDEEGAFTLALPTNAPTGAQTLTFTIRVGDETVTLTANVTVAAPALQSLNVDPDAAATLSLATTAQEADPATTGQDDRAYTATGLTNGTTYRVTLVNAAQIQTDAQGNVTFLSSADPDSSTGFSVDVGADVADIISANNVATPANTNTTTVQPVNGTITFVVDGTGVGTVVPVVYVNGGVGGTATTGGTSIRLETNATAASVTAGTFSAPVESFGVGGPVSFINPAATTQALSASAVQRVNKGANTFDANDLTFTYDANDTFAVAAAGTPTNFLPASLDEFEAALSSGDSIQATYSATPGASSSFRLVDSNPTAPTTVTAEAGTVGAATNDITVTVALAGDIDTVVIQRAPVTGTGATDEATTGTVGTFATVATVTPTAADVAANALAYVDQDVPAGVYRYRAAVVNDGQQSAFTADPNNEASVAPSPDSDQPVATATTLVTDAGFAGILDSGDVFTVRTDEALAAPAAGATIRVADGDNSVADLVCGTNATCALNSAANPASPAGPNAGAAAGTVLTVTVTAAPSVVAAGGTPGVAYPATITNTLGITDVAGNRLNVTTTGVGVDRVIG